MNEVMDAEIVEASTDGSTTKKHWLFITALILTGVAVITVLVLLMSGIFPLGKYLQSVDWIFNFAKKICG